MNIKFKVLLATLVVIGLLLIPSLENVDSSQQSEQPIEYQVITPPAAPDPNDAILEGNIGLTGYGAVNLIIRFFVPDSPDTEVMIAASPTNASGNFTIYGITPGTYDVGVKCDNSKSILVEDAVFTAGNTTEIAFGNLLRGDLNQDDAVIALDFSILNAQFNTIGDCWGYAGDWLMPECPEVATAVGRCYFYIIG